VCEATTPPWALTNAVDGNVVALAWTAASLNVTYIVEAGSEDGASDIGTFGSAVPGFAVVARPGRYFARVRAVGPCGTSSPSNESIIEVGQFPEAPTNLAATVLGATVTLNWQAPAGNNVLSYVVEAGTGPEAPANLLVHDVGATLSFTVSNVPTGSYFVRVRAAGQGGALGPPSKGIWVIVR
jgi:hypothetical protein